MNKKRVIIVMFIATALIFFFVGSMRFSGKAMLESNIYTIEHPKSLYRTFDLVDSIRLINYRFEYYFGSLAFVVRISLVLTIVCTVIMILIGIQVELYRHKRHQFEKKKRKEYSKLIPKINKIVQKETKEMTLEEVIDVINTNHNFRISTFKEAAFFMTMFYYYIFTTRKNTNLYNAYQALKAIGIIDFVEEKLLKGKDKEKSAAIQIAVMLNLYINVSYVSRIINTRNLSLRKQARMYYMLQYHEDSYKYLDNIDFELSLWDQIELHQIVKLCKLDHKPLPVFVTAIRLEKKSINKAFFIREAGYWGQNIEIQALKPYITDSDERIRRAAIKCMTQRRVGSAVDLIKQAAFNSTQHTVRLCLRSILIIHNGNQTPFFKYMYQHASGYRTRRVALICLRLYDKDSLKVYENLHHASNGIDKDLFDEVEETIKQEELYGGILDSDNTLSIIRRYVTDTI
jgi:hypothetical protein